MRRSVWGLLVAGAALAGVVNLAAAEDEGVVVEFDGLRSKAPASWKEEKVTVLLRYKQFRLPAVKDDKNPAEVVIFKGISGTTKANIDRWKAMFTPDEGKKLDDVAKVSEFKVGGSEVHYLDIQGTYLFKTRPFDPNDKGEKRANYRMLGVVFEGPGNTYHIRLVGPAATVEHYKAGFDGWLKAFR